MINHDLLGPSTSEPEDVAIPVRNHELHQFFTAPWVAEELIDNALEGMGKPSILEPSCGAGAFLGAIPQDCPALGVEIDPRWKLIAEKNSGRRVITGDFTTCDLEGFEYQMLLGNPAFTVSTIDAFLNRGHRELPEDGLIAFILPAYAFQTARTVTNWMDRFSISLDMIPRNIFPGLSKPLVWAKFRKTGIKRYRGLLLFRETDAINAMNRFARDALTKPGTWKEAVTQALASLGGEASLPAIYDAITPARRETGFWKEKIRQTLARYGFVPKGQGRWALPLPA